MNRIILIVGGALGASGLMVVDSAIKGLALMVLAWAAAVLLRRDSAATRHLLWLLAMGALLAAPVLSVVLPQWRVLPGWVGIRQGVGVVVVHSAAVEKAADAVVEAPRDVGAESGERAGASGGPAAAMVGESRAAPAALQAIPGSAIGKRNWLNVLPVVWVAGFCVLGLRLMAARWVLWRAERRGRIIGSSAGAAEGNDEAIVVALRAAALQLGLKRRVTLLIHPGRVIPVVWGIFRCRLMLPAAAREWDGEQLRSVLLHEMAHVKRHDMAGQLVAQLACAVHWFNPLVWVGAWRLGVERERACDDLVLASGVRASAYAGHLLDVVTALSPGGWTQSCGLAMARASSLEGRLLAVLSGKRNRRGVSVVLGAVAAAIAFAVAVPVAMLRAADEKPKSKAATMEVKPQVEAGAEENLRWGEAVKGLRAAVVFRPARAALKASELPEMYVAVQNVSDGRIRLNDTLAEQQPRMLYIKSDGRIQAGIGAKDPRLGEVVLQPREVAYVLMYSAERSASDGRTIGELMAGDVMKDTHETVVAEFLIEKAPAGAWTGKLVTGETSGAVAAGQPQPKDKSGRALMDVWQHHVRGNGNFPGGLVGGLGEKMKEFIRNNTGDAAGDPYAKKMAPLMARIDASRDWSAAELVALIDDIAVVTPIPLETTMDELAGRRFRKGAPLPKELVDAPWGEAQANGLRMALLLEPRGEEHAVGAALKSRILIQNSGKDVVVFRTRTWHQLAHTARDAKGAEMKVEGTSWLTRGPLMAFRLWPGEFVEVRATGIGIGKHQENAAWRAAQVGSWVETKAGDEVTITSAGVPLGDWNEAAAKDGEAGWWLDLIKADLALDLPLPADAQERERLVYRAGLEVFGTPLSSEEIGAFVGDREAGALDRLAQRFAKRAGTVAAGGEVKSGVTKFRVVAAEGGATKPATGGEK